MADILKQITLSEEFFYLGQQIATNENSINQNKPQNAPSFSDHEQLKKQAQEEGFQIGFALGKAEGFAQGEMQATYEAAERSQQLSHLLQTIPATLSANRQELKAEIADIVLAITQQFFIQQQQSKEAIAQQITATLNYLNDKQAITLALHPQDLHLLQQGELNIDFSQCQDLRIIADESLSLGGCRIKSTHGIFDAGIERQIDCLKHALLQIKQRNSHE